MVCRKLSYYPQESFRESEVNIFWTVERKTASGQKKKKDYYAGGSVARRLNTPNSYFDHKPDGGRTAFGKFYNYGYQGQFAMEDSETGWNSFELRMYDPVILRWTTTDPYDEFWSPYVGMGNDPINLIDPDGGKVLDDIYYLDGEEAFRVVNDKPDRFFELTPNEDFTTGFEAIEIPNPIANPSVLFATNNTGYVYSTRDLSVRMILLSLGNGNVVTSAMLRGEREGNFIPLHSKEYYRDYVARWETNSAFWFAIEEGYFTVPGAGGPNGGAMSRQALAGYQKGLAEFSKSMRNIKRPGGGFSPRFKVDLRKASLTKTRWNQFQHSYKGQFSNASKAYNRIFFGK